MTKFDRYCSGHGSERAGVDAAGAQDGRHARAGGLRALRPRGRRRAAPPARHATAPRLPRVQKTGACFCFYYVTDLLL